MRWRSRQRWGARGRRGWHTCQRRQRRLGHPFHGHQPKPLLVEGAVGVVGIRDVRVAGVVDPRVARCILPPLVTPFEHKPADNAPDRARGGGVCRERSRQTTHLKRLRRLVLATKHHRPRIGAVLGDEERLRTQSVPLHEQVGEPSTAIHIQSPCIDLGQSVVYRGRRNLAPAEGDRPACGIERLDQACQRART